MKVQPTDEEIRFSKNEIIVSKTDLKGRIEYVNDVFCRVSEMSTAEVVGQPHSIIRHPDMPRTVFQLLWETIQKGEEIFAYVKNMSATGKYYWVIAHVTPTRDQYGEITGFHSNRRVPSQRGIDDIEPLYRELRQMEGADGNRKDGLANASRFLQEKLSQLGKTYEQFIWSTGE